MQPSVDVSASSSYRRFCAFFVPLALQSVSQSLSYPLVAMVASRGDGGALNMAGMAQASSIMGLFWTFGIGMMTAGMVYVRSQEAYRRFVVINRLMILALMLLYGLCCIPVCAHQIFGVLLGLPPSMERPAVLAFWTAFPILPVFHLRTPFYVVLYNHKATGQAFVATVVRILLTLVLSPVMCYGGLVGPVWAMVCLGVPVACESLMARVMAQPYHHQMPHSDAKPPRYGEVIGFALTLSLGALFVTLSGFMLSAFIARAPNPEHTLPVYCAVMGLAGPVAYGARRQMELMITFYHEPAVRRFLFRFSLAAGLIMGIIPLFFIVPGIRDWYYIDLQRLGAEDMRMVTVTAFALVLFPVVVGIRGLSEGVASCYRKPSTILAGQAVYLAMVVVLAFAALQLGMPGHWIGPVSLILANLGAAGIVQWSLYWDRQNEDKALPPGGMAIEDKS